jgi:DNA-directed RNA polymerase specialized sigma54-like protein
MIKKINNKSEDIFLNGVNQAFRSTASARTAIKQRCRKMIEKEWNNKFLSNKPINQ